MSTNTLLDEVRAVLIVDIDSMDHGAAKTLTQGSKPFKFHDMTSNQAIVHGQVEQQWDSLFTEVEKYVKENGLNVQNEDDVHVLKVINLLVSYKTCVIHYGWIHDGIDYLNAHIDCPPGQESISLPNGPRSRPNKPISCL